jgi:Cu+-exporting ATPase
VKVNYSNQIDKQEVTFCFHCGDPCPDLDLIYQEKYFCCDGCRFVYEILDKNNLCNYYELNAHPGNTLKAPKASKKYDYLAEPSIEDKFVSFKNKHYSVITLYLPGIHCSSCLWLLQNLNKFDGEVLNSNVSFEKKEIKVIYKHQKTSLHKIVKLIDSLGYPPSITFEDIYNKKKPESSKAILYKIGVAAFCFGNIMMLSFPDYLTSETIDPFLGKFFRILSFVLSLPVLFYCASEFYKPAFKSLRHGFINIDLPIVFALLMAFGVSIYHIFFLNEGGYLDSMAGIVFFMLVGRWLQNKTYNNIYFDKNYQSFLPVSVTQKMYNQVKNVQVKDIVVGDIIVVKYGEIIPFDGIIKNGLGIIDYSFITGETATENIEKGEKVYAGGKHLGTQLELEVTTPYDKTNIAELWQANNSNKIYQTPSRLYIQKISRYFALLLIFIAIGAGVYHFGEGWNMTIKTFTSVLIVACPCTLLLSHTFTDGFMLNQLAKKGLFIKNTMILDEVATIKHIVFDKTGTLTDTSNMQITYQGEELNTRARSYIYNLTTNSGHPLSNSINKFIGKQPLLNIENYKELVGLGLEGIIEHHSIRIGSAEFMNVSAPEKSNKTIIYISIDNKLYGYFEAFQSYRKDLQHLFNKLKSKYVLWLMSGDKDYDRKLLEQYVPSKENIFFELKPQEKQNKIKSLKLEGKTMMVGDGLNDLAAFNESDIAVAVWNDETSFTPACDIIVQGKNLNKMDQYISYMKNERLVVYFCFGISLLYNIVGITFSVCGMLSPLIAAVLMPISSFSIILFAYAITNYLNNKYLKDL